MFDRVQLLSSLALFACVSASAEAQSDAPAEIYQFNTLAIEGDEDDSYVDLFAGDDLLPYTDDDIALPERGNVGGTWGFAHHDLNSDGAVSESEHIFVVIRRGDDDQFGFTVNSRPEYGVIYEAEDWIDYHDARNEGPSATLIGDLGAEGNDFEHNDRPFWEGESNAFLYNNAMPNQHGKSKPRYYFEHINPGSEPAAEEPFIFDEIEGFRKPLNFQHNMDDPTTEFNERGDCRREYMRTFDAVTRGYLIPVTDLGDLEDGSLPSLFGWEAEGFDLATYLRDTITPKLFDEDDASQPNPNMTLFHTLNGTVSQNLPISHLMLLQVEAPIVVNIGESCGAGQEQAEAMAAYWGIEDDGATYRVSHLLGMKASLPNELLGEGAVHPWVDAPDDGELRNLWHLDHFMRDSSEHLGNYTSSPPEATWIISPDPTGFGFDASNNRILETTGGGMIRAPLVRPLGNDELPLELLVDLSKSDEEDTSFQIVLFADEEPLVRAEITPDTVNLILGGTDEGDGWIDGGESVSGEEPELGGIEFSEYTRYVLKITPTRISVLEGLHEEFVTNDFTGLDSDTMSELVGIEVEAGGGFAAIDELAVAADAPGFVSTIALFAAPPGSFVPDVAGARRPGDCNADGSLNISDGICLLGHLFLGSPTRLPCGDGTREHPGNTGLLDNEGNGEVQLTDAISIFSFLFLGGAPLAPCSDELCLECVEIVGCTPACP